MRLYNGFPDRELKAVLNSKQKARDKAKELGYLITYYPQEGMYGASKQNTYEIVSPMCNTPEECLKYIHDHIVIKGEQRYICSNINSGWPIKIMGYSEDEHEGRCLIGERKSLRYNELRESLKPDKIKDTIRLYNSLMEPGRKPVDETIIAPIDGYRTINSKYFVNIVLNYLYRNSKVRQIIPNMLWLSKNISLEIPKDSRYLIYNILYE